MKGNKYSFNLILFGSNRSWTAVRCGDGGRYSAPHAEPCHNLHPSRFDGAYKVIQYLVRHGLMKGPLVAIGPKIQLQRFKLHAEFVRDIVDGYICKIRLARLWTKAGELRTVAGDDIIAQGRGVRKRVERLGRLCWHITCSSGRHRRNLWATWPFLR